MSFSPFQSDNRPFQEKSLGLNSAKKFKYFFLLQILPTFNWFDLLLSGSGQLPCPSGCCELTETRRRRRRRRRRRTRRRRRRRRETQRRNFCPGATHALPSNPTTAGVSKIISTNVDHENTSVAVSENIVKSSQVWKY